MPLPTDKTKGPIRFSVIRQTFGGAPPDGLKEYYKGGDYVDENDVAPNIPASGKNRASNYYGARPASMTGTKLFSTPGIGEFVIPDYDNYIEFDAKGGGGASGTSSLDYAGAEPGLVGFPGQGSYVTGPDGTITGGSPVYAPFRRQPVFYMSEPTVGAAWVHGGAGQGGNGYPSTTPGVEGVGGIRNADDDDILEPGKGGAGGICPPDPFLGTVGGAGGRAVKRFKKSEPGAPRPGEVWKYHVGSGARDRGALNGKGQDGSIQVNWG